MTLDVAISTYRPEGIMRVARMNLPTIPGVRYIVSWQEHEDAPIPEELKRDDVSIHRWNERGVSGNRNNAISHCDADLVYLSDDDIEIIPKGIRKIISRFEEYPDTQMGTFKMKETGINVYPKEVTDLSFYLPRNYNIATCHMAFRRDIFPAIKFHPSFGTNSGIFEGSEDELFHFTARKHGIKCRFFPDIVASHPHESSGQRKITNPKVVEGLGAFITKSNPHSFFLRLPLKAYRMKKKGQYNFLGALFHLTKGSINSFRYKI